MAMIQIDRTLDARGLACPMPIVKTAQADQDDGRRASRSRSLATDAGLGQGLRGLVANDRQRPRRAPALTAAVYRFVLRRK